MTFCNVCNKGNISGDLTTIGNQSVCCLSCVGLLKSNKKDACSCCGRPVWKDNYYEIDNLYFCSEKCKNKIQEKIIKEKGVKYIKIRHFNEEKYYKESPKNIQKFIKEEKIQNNFYEQNNEVYESNEWNKNSFIQKESDTNENNNNKKDSMKISYRIEKSIHKKNIYSNNNNNNNYSNNYKIPKKNSLKNKKKEKKNLIKNMIKYFREDKIYSNKNNKKYEIKTNNKKQNKHSLNKKEQNNINNHNFPSLPNLNYNKSSMNSINIKEENPFIFQNINKEEIKKEIRSNTLKNENHYNKNTIGYSYSNLYIFNPIRKTENFDIIKKNSYPIDSLTFPIDSLTMPNGNKNTSVNCCNNCRKPIIIRNSNTHKDFCSINCRNEYYKNIEI